MQGAKNMHNPILNALRQHSSLTGNMLQDNLNLIQSIPWLMEWDWGGCHLSGQLITECALP
jgi:hypothetical protein